MLYSLDLVSLMNNKNNIFITHIMLLQALGLKWWNKYAEHDWPL